MVADMCHSPSHTSKSHANRNGQVDPGKLIRGGVDIWGGRLTRGRLDRLPSQTPSCHGNLLSGTL